MTPAINIAKKEKITFTVHKYKHDPKHESYGMEAVEMLGLPAERVYKTLVTRLDDDTLTVAVVPVTGMLDLKLLAQACGTKKAEMADRALVTRTTGYVLGGVSPLGQKKRLKTILDISARNHPTIYVSAGRRGLEIELSPTDLARLTSGSFAAIS